MKTFNFSVSTTARDQMLDITDKVAGLVSEAGISDGAVTVYIPHTTAGVTINENADPDVIHDILGALNEAVPHHRDFYRHSEGNSAAHVKSSMVGCSAAVPIADGRMMLGTWQSIFFCEFDGPRTRKVLVTLSS